MYLRVSPGAKAPKCTTWFSQLMSVVCFHSSTTKSRFFTCQKHHLTKPFNWAPAEINILIHPTPPPGRCGFWSLHISLVDAERAPAQPGIQNYFGGHGESWYWLCGTHGWSSIATNGKLFDSNIVKCFSFHFIFILIHTVFMIPSWNRLSSLQGKNMGIFLPEIETITVKSSSTR